MMKTGENIVEKKIWEKPNLKALSFNKTNGGPPDNFPEEFEGATGS
jgi:hypothetical protein